MLTNVETQLLISGLWLGCCLAHLYYLPKPLIIMTFTCWTVSTYTDTICRTHKSYSQAAVKCSVRVSEGVFLCQVCVNGPLSPGVCTYFTQFEISEHEAAVANDPKRVTRQIKCHNSQTQAVMILCSRCVNSPKSDLGISFPFSKIYPTSSHGWCHCSVTSGNCCLLQEVPTLSSILLYIS